MLTLWEQKDGLAKGQGTSIQKCVSYGKPVLSFAPQSKESIISE